MSRRSPSQCWRPGIQAGCGNCCAQWRRLADRRSSAHRLRLAVESVLGGSSIVVVELLRFKRRRVLDEVDEVECTGAGRCVSVVLQIVQQSRSGNIGNSVDAVRDVLLTFAYFDLQFVFQRLNLKIVHHKNLLRGFGRHIRALDCTVGRFWRAAKNAVDLTTSDKQNSQLARCESLQHLICFLPVSFGVS
jgi:hypothetical protein